MSDYDTPAASAPDSAAATSARPEMNVAAAEVLAQLALGVDRGCAYCVKDLIDKLVAAFPDHAGVFQATYDSWAGSKDDPYDWRFDTADS